MISVSGAYGGVLRAAGMAACFALSAVAGCGQWDVSGCGERPAATTGATWVAPATPSSTAASTNEAAKENQMTSATQAIEQPSAVMMKGKPLTLLGKMPKVGDKAPNFTAVGNDLSEVRLSDYAGKVVIISAVPSLDTAVCDRETRRFNKEASSLGGDVQILTVSMDLPFAQKRWCAAEGIKDVRTVSDHRDGQFGAAYGVTIKELRLLARAIFVVDKQGTIRYVELVKEIADEPDYQGALDAAKQLTAK